MMSTAAPPRTRMTVEARREQLLRVASEHFAKHPYADVHVARIAEAAGVSLGLIYHYFGDKQGLFAAVVDDAIEQLGEATRPDPDLEPMARARSAIDRYIDYVQTNEHAYRAMHRGAQSGDTRVRQALERNTQRQIDRICQALLGTTDGPPKLRTALRGWLAYVIATCLDWIENHQVTRDELRMLHLHALASALTAAYAETEPADPTQDPALPFNKG